MERVMRLVRYILPSIVAAWGLVGSSAFAADCGCKAKDADCKKEGSGSDLEDFTDELDERDFEAVAEYVNAKRAEDVKDKACGLVISGDIRTEWSYITEVLNGRRLRGGFVDRCGSGFLSNNDFDIDVNLYFDYKCERAWGRVHIEYDNPAGVQESDKICGKAPVEYDRCGRIDPIGAFGSGRCDSLCLRKAFLGFNICSDGTSRLDIEVGRRRLYDVFDSRIQFLARFDGLLLRYATQVRCTDLYWNVAALVVDERSNHFAYVTELGALNVLDSGFDLKYSYIDWLKHGLNRCEVLRPYGWRFRNSQWSLAYRFNPECLCRPAKVYGAFIINHEAGRLKVTRNRLENKAWYAGFLIGEVEKEGDWSLDCNYQYCEARAVPDPDVSGIGRGNFFRETFTMAIPLGDPANARGEANYKGVRIEGLYALTDELSIDAVFQCSKPAETAIGGPLRYNKFKIEAIYAF